MSTPINDPIPSHTYNRRFAAMYDRLSRSKLEQRLMEPIRRNTAGRATGVVLEVGAGTGSNFAFYRPEQVERVEAVEPDTAMIGYAQKNLKSTQVPITITQAPAESLPFPDATFDSVVVTLVFCSVTDQTRAFSEIKRVLKPGGILLMSEHVRSRHTILAGVQDALVPITTRLLGNCHWNRETAHTMLDAGFVVTYQCDVGGILLPKVLLQATRV